MKKPRRRSRRKKPHKATLKPQDAVAKCALLDEIFTRNKRTDVSATEALKDVDAAVELYWVTGGKAAYDDVVGFDGYEKWLETAVADLIEITGCSLAPCPLYPTSKK